MKSNMWQALADELDPPPSRGERRRRMALTILHDNVASTLSSLLGAVECGRDVRLLNPADREMLGIPMAEEGHPLIERLVGLYAKRLGELGLDIAVIAPRLTRWQNRSGA